MRRNVRRTVIRPNSLAKGRAAKRVVVSALGVAAIAGVFAGGFFPAISTTAQAEQAGTSPAVPALVGVRRLSEDQYHNTIADIFGPDIAVAGRFEPMVRPPHHLLASASTSASISPTGMEQFDAIARGVAAQVFDEKHRANIVSCTPRSPAEADDACAAATMGDLGRLLFRRPLSDAERATFTQIAAQSTKRTGSFYTGLELSLAAMLISPEFLYVIERAEPDPARPGHRRLDAWSKASRLSFVLWNAAPSPELLDAAQRGDLNDDKRLQAIAAAMIKSPRFQQGVRAFFADMLLFEKFDELTKDPLIYRRYTADVAKALPEQMLRTIVDHTVTRAGDYRELFTTRRTFVNRTLGPLYDMPVTAASGWVPYEFPADSDRGGIAALPGFLTIYAHSGRSSPTLRGRAIRELLLCQPVPDPPGDVNFTAVQDTSNKEMPTARIRLTAHVDNPVCAGCHKITDPIGLSLERFDGIGAYRRIENGAEIDTSGMIGEASFKGAVGLGKALAADGSASQCVATRALEYATGRPAEESPMLAAVEQQFQASGYRIPALFLRIATMAEAYQVNDSLSVTRTASR